MGVITEELTDKKKVKILHILIGAQSDILQFKHANLSAIVTGFIQIVSEIAGIDGLDYLIARVRQVKKTIADADQKKDAS